MVVEVMPGVWRAGTRYVNWWIVDGGGDGLTLVDCGLPGYRDAVAPTLARIGRSISDVAAVVLTHGHIDHVGTAGALAQAGARVYLHAADAELAANPKRNRTDGGPLPYLLWPATFAFVAHAIRQGALRAPEMPRSVPIHDGDVLDAPGRPSVTHTPGHTDGSCVLEFREHGVVFVGDLLCTTSPVTGRPVTPQLQTRGSNRDSAEALGSLGRLERLGCRVVLPGHGPAYRDGVEAAVRSARATGCR